MVGDAHFCPKICSSCHLPLATKKATGAGPPPPPSPTAIPSASPPFNPAPLIPPFFRNFFRVIHHSPLFLPRPHPALLHSRRCGRGRGKGKRGRGRGSISCRAATLSTLSEKGGNAWREIRRLFIVKSIVMMHDIFRY